MKLFESRQTAKLHQPARNMTLSRLFNYSAAIALLLVISCGGGDPPTGQDDFEFSGEYTLQAVNGVALPALEQIDGWTGDSLIATAGKIRVLSNGRLQVVHSSEWHSRTSGVRTNPTDTITSAYTIDGQVVLIEYTRFPPHTDTLVVNGTSLVFSTLATPSYAMSHRRLDIYFRP